MYVLLDGYGYLPLIQACDLPRSEIGKVGFLTIHEAEVNAGESHRRGGLHIDCPGMLLGEDGAVLTPSTMEELGWGRTVVIGDERGGCRQGSLWAQEEWSYGSRV